MNTYQLGLVTAPQKQSLWGRGIQVGALIATPGAIKDEANDLNAEIIVMDQELGQQRAAWGLVQDANLDPLKRTMDLWWKANWVPFFEQWHKFWTDHGNTWGLRNWYENFWGSSWDQVQDYRRKLISLRQSAKLVGFGFNSPEPTPPKGSPWGEAASEIWTVLKTIIYVGLIVVGGYLVFKVLGSTGTATAAVAS